jgi:hypothetical protein
MSRMRAWEVLRIIEENLQDDSLVEKNRIIISYSKKGSFIE